MLSFNVPSDIAGDGLTLDFLLLVSVSFMSVISIRNK